jgi:hypothetical protein
MSDAKAQTDAGTDTAAGHARRLHPIPWGECFMSKRLMMEHRARVHLMSRYREYLWHSSVAHATQYESIRDRRTVLADQARWDAMACYWIITGNSAWR